MTSDNDGSGRSHPASGTGDDSGASDVDVHLDEQTKEEVGEWVKSALEGTHRLADVAEVAEHLTNAVSHLTDVSAAEATAEEAASSAVGEAAGALAEGLEVVNSVLGPIGAVTLVVLVGSEIVDAFKSEKSVTRKSRASVTV
jgi:hypothetical protein